MPRLLRPEWCRLDLGPETKLELHTPSVVYRARGMTRSICIPCAISAVVGVTTFWPWRRACHLVASLATLETRRGAVPKVMVTVDGHPTATVYRKELLLAKSATYVQLRLTVALLLTVLGAVVQTLIRGQLIGPRCDPTVSDINQEISMGLDVRQLEDQ